MSNSNKTSPDEALIPDFERIQRSAKTRAFRGLDMSVGAIAKSLRLTANQVVTAVREWGYYLHVDDRVGEIDGWQLYWEGE